MGEEEEEDDDDVDTGSDFIPGVLSRCSLFGASEEPCDKRQREEGKKNLTGGKTSSFLESLRRFTHDLMLVALLCYYS